MQTGGIKNRKILVKGFGNTKEFNLENLTINNQDGTHVSVFTQSNASNLSITNIYQQQAKTITTKN